MHWPTKDDDKTAWSAVGGVIALAAVTVGIASVAWPVVTVLAVLGVYLMLAPLLDLAPWHRVKRTSRQSGIWAGHGIEAGGDIEVDGTINAGHGIRTGGSIRSSAQADPLLLATAKRKSDRAQLGLVNPLVGRLLIRQYADPLEHNQAGCVIRVAIAGDHEPNKGELRSNTKDALKNALNRSSLERWVCTRTDSGHPMPSVGWEHASPNSGRVVTFKRDWGALGNTGSRLTGKTTLQLPPNLMLGQRVILVVDLVEQSVGIDDDLPRLCLSLSSLYWLLHTLSRTAVEDLVSAVFPLVYNDFVPRMLGPNYEIQLGDRTLENFIQIPTSFRRPNDAQSLPWANINTPDDSDAYDLRARDAVLRQGLEAVLRNNGYDAIEDEISKLAISKLPACG